MVHTNSDDIHRDQFKDYRAKFAIWVHIRVSKTKRNLIGNVTEIRKPSGIKDGRGRLRRDVPLRYGGGMRYEYAYYQGGLLKEKKASGKALVSCEYDAFGRKTSQTDLTGKHTGYRYHPNGMLSQVLGNGNVLAGYDYHTVVVKHFCNTCG